MSWTDLRLSDLLFFWAVQFWLVDIHQSLHVTTNSGDHFYMKLLWQL